MMLLSGKSPGRADQGLHWRGSDSVLERKHRVEMPGTEARGARWQLRRAARVPKSRF